MQGSVALYAWQMVEKGCASCKEWQEHYYWEHMDVSKIRFFRFMTGDFAKGIRLPEKFTRKLDGQITETFDLKTANGEAWRIGIDKNGDELFLMSGWKDFVKAHELRENDLLIFTYSGNSSFEVLIFEASGYEKVSSRFANIITHRMLPESPNMNNDDHNEVEAFGEQDSDEEVSNSNYYYLKIANRLSDEEKEKIISLASIRSDNPAFFTVLQMSHVRRNNNFLVFPSRFVADHLDSRLHEITLCRPNMKDKWCVKYYRARDSQGIRNYNFAKFVNENKLSVGDICAFELMKGASRRVIMTVHVIRKVANRFVLVG
ncbi:hypothetical protein QOZ80_5BG0444500 [Eleusine coracana subsp. coracana]|nr:hypothetical protein QOZ80_5BG0444500 [Eleusine coracana subsp. coracana]